MRNSEETFWARVDKTDSCWLWTGTVTPNGYGKMSYGGRYQYAHRLAWFFTHGPLDINLVIDHLCHNPPCVNPAHLRLTDTSGNMQNRAGCAANNKAGYRNVHWTGKKWRAQIRANGRNYSGGLHDDPAEASRAAERLRAEHMDYNFPPLS